MPRAKKERRGEKPQWRSTKKAWMARVWEADGRCSGWLPVGTGTQEEAQAAYERWLRTGEPPAGSRSAELFGEAALRVTDEAEAAEEVTPKLAKQRRQRLRDYALPELAHLEVGHLEPHHVASCLDAAARAGIAAGTILKLRSDISQILEWLIRKGVLSANVAIGVSISKGAAVDTRERVSLSDEQYLVFFEKHGMADPLGMKVGLSRCVGGHRTSDLDAGDWSDVASDYSLMKVRRPKLNEGAAADSRVGRRRVLAYEKVDHVIAEPVRSALRAYHEAQGSPERGPIFPLERDAVRGGGKKGDRRKPGSSEADAFRRAVHACGITDDDHEHALPAGHAGPRLCRLQTDTKTTRRLTFHSIRGDLSTALSDAGVNDATALAITGHTQMTTKLRHYMGRRRVGVPAGALPGGQRQAEGGGAAALTEAQREALGALLGVKIPGPGMIQSRSEASESHNSANLQASPTGVEPMTRALGMHLMALGESQARGTTSASDAHASASNPVLSQRVGENASTLQASIARAALDGDFALVEELTVIAKRRSQAPLAPVHKLSDARKRRG